MQKLIDWQKVSSRGCSAIFQSYQIPLWNPIQIAQRLIDHESDE